MPTIITYRFRDAFDEALLEETEDNEESEEKVEEKKEISITGEVLGKIII